MRIATLRAVGPLLVALAICGLGLEGCGGGSSAAGGGTATTGSAASSAAGALGWSSGSTAWPQMAAAAVATVTRSDGGAGTATVAYSTQDATAVAGRDYSAATGTLTWANNDTTPKSVAVRLGSSAWRTVPLSFRLLLENPGGGATVAASSSRTTVTLAPAWTIPATLPRFDLSKWRLDLPVDANGGMGGNVSQQLPADAILPSELDSTYVGPYFYGDAQGDIVFTAPANGAVTTPGVGSNHTRSELHEVYAGPGADANGNWTGHGVLTATCSVQSAASASDVVIIGQLRGVSNDLALIMYRPAKHDVAVDVYTTNAAGSTHVRTPLVTNIGLGDTIHYSIAYQGGVLTATANGMSRTTTVDASWSGVPLYFKLGAYHTAPHTGNAPNDLTMVTFSAFSVTH